MFAVIHRTSSLTPRSRRLQTNFPEHNYRPMKVNKEILLQWNSAVFNLLCWRQWIIYNVSDAIMQSRFKLRLSTCYSKSFILFYSGPNGDTLLWPCHVLKSLIHHAHILYYGVCRHRKISIRSEERLVLKVGSSLFHNLVYSLTRRDFANFRRLSQSSCTLFGQLLTTLAPFVK